MMKKILTLMMSTALLFGTQSTVFADTGITQRVMFIPSVLSCMIRILQRWKCLQIITGIILRKVFL